MRLAPLVLERDFHLAQPIGVVVAEVERGQVGLLAGRCRAGDRRAHTDGDEVYGALGSVFYLVRVEVRVRAWAWAWVRVRVRVRVRVGLRVRVRLRVRLRFRLGLRMRLRLRRRLRVQVRSPPVG